MEDGEAGDGVKAGRGHVKIVAHAYHVRVGVIRLNYRIAVRAIAVVGGPNLGYLGKQSSYASEGKNDRAGVPQGGGAKHASAYQN